MPAPVVEPMPPSRALRLAPPEDAQEASYLAASARISSFRNTSRAMASLYVLVLFFASRGSASIACPRPNHPGLGCISDEGRTGERMMEPGVRKFFERYERVFNRSLGGEIDTDEIAAL